MKLAITLLVTSVAALLSLGMVMLYSSSMVQVGAHYLIMQLIWCGLGLVGCVVMAAIDYTVLRKLAWPLFGMAVVLLGVVLLTPKINGASRWIRVGGFTMQPSEFAKVALIIAVAWYCERFLRKMGSFKRGILIPGMFSGVVLGLIFLEPDVGNAILIAAVVAAMLLIAGIPMKYFLPPVLIGSLAMGTFIYHNPMRSQRIYSWLHVEETKRAKGMQAYESMVALGSGGITGKGLGNGRQKLGWIDEHHTDFILSIIGEELGLIATLLVVLGFLIIVICGLYIAMHARDNFGLLLGCGITFLIGFQALINIGVVTSALPNKGMPLPFISYGGSNLLMMLLCVGVLLSIARHARETIAKPDAIFAPDNPFAPRTA